MIAIDTNVLVYAHRAEMELHDEPTMTSRLVGVCSFQPPTA